MKNSVFVSFGVAAACVLAGCGDDGPAVDPAERFVGEWEYVSGQGSITCPAPIPMMALPWMGNKLPLRKGTTSALEADKQITDQRCTLKLSLMGAIATAVPDQKCNLSAMFMGMNLAATMSVSSYTFTLSADGMTLTEAGMGTATANIGIPLSCGFASTGQLKKVQ